MTVITQYTQVLSKPEETFNYRLIDLCDDCRQTQPNCSKMGVVYNASCQICGARDEMRQRAEADLARSLADAAAQPYAGPMTQYEQTIRTSAGNEAGTRYINLCVDCAPKYAECKPIGRAYNSICFRCGTRDDTPAPAQPAIEQVETSERSAYTIRRISPAGVAALKQHAGAAGLSIEAFLRQTIEQLALTPIAQTTAYRYFAQCDAGGLLDLTIYPDREPRLICTGLDDRQLKAGTAAMLLAGQPGSKLAIGAILSGAFDRVVEMPAS